MPATRVEEYLTGNHVKYLTIVHSPAYTTQEMAAEAHISGKEIAKTVMVKLDNRMAMAVLPAPARIDFERLAEVTGAESAELAEEDEFRDLFPNCEVGAMPPFGNLYGMDVVEDVSLKEDEEIVFNAESWSRLLRLPRIEFERLVHPREGSFAMCA